MIFSLARGFLPSFAESSIGRDHSFFILRIAPPIGFQISAAGLEESSCSWLVPFFRPYKI
jgi:hypothetical protein